MREMTTFGLETACAEVHRKSPFEHDRTVDLGQRILRVENSISGPQVWIKKEGSQERKPPLPKWIGTERGGPATSPRPANSKLP